MVVRNSPGSGVSTSSKPASTIIITTIDPPGPSVRCHLFGGVPAYTSTNGWQFTQLPRRQAMTEFMGHDGYTMVVPVRFGDGVSTDSIEPKLEVLRGIARNRVGPRVEPAVVQIDCPAVPLNWLKYVINNIEFKTEYRNNDGSRYYAQVDITFFEWQPTALVLTKTGKSATQLLVSATKASSSGSVATKLTSTPVVTPTGIKNGPSSPILANVLPSSSVYYVKVWDTLESIAKVTLGNANLWKEIANLNFVNGHPIRDPKSLKVGQVLRMPVGAKIPKADKNPPPAPPNPTGILGQSGVTDFWNWIPG